jgi:hypothetical protein
MVLGIAASLSACAPAVKVEAPLEPITIHLNVKSDTEQRIRGESEARPVTSAVDEKSEDITLLSRAFLPRHISPQPGFGFYAYLLFPRNLPQTYTQRLAAAAAFLCLFEDVTKATELVDDRSTLAVLYAPISSIGLREELLKKRDPVLLVRHYDYRRAYLFATQNGLDPNELYIIGQRDFFTPEGNVEPTQFQAARFSERPPNEGLDVLASLEDRLVQSQILIAEHEVDLIETIRTVFRTLGEFSVAAMTAIGTAHAESQVAPVFSCP